MKVGETGRPGIEKKYKAKTESELAETSGEFLVEVGGSSASSGCDVMYSAATAATAVVPTVAKSVVAGEARLPGFAKYNSKSVSESELAESSDEASSFGEVEAGSLWSQSQVERPVQQSQKHLLLVAAAHEAGCGTSTRPGS